ncbi:Hypp9588 [Branchiostoma lanceolatum]|uniref:Hypp9588 protein n=1 Tax=Branchiostoma lanceolatum TaxID=7740 RepID=A0A8S4MNN9_BRALA|nr:Hypp9588 [Branchiostoma lanceolatum]
MKTPTLVLAVILAMAVGEKTIDDALVTHINTLKTEGEGTDTNSKDTRFLGFVNKLDLASSKAEPEDTKEGAEEGADVEQIYDAIDSDFEEKGGKGYADKEKTYDVAKIGSGDSSFEETNTPRPPGWVDQAEAYDSLESVATLTSKLRDILDLPDPHVKAAKTALKNIQGPQNKIGGRSTDGSKETKKAVPAFLAAAAKEIGGKVVSKLGDRIAEGVVENHQDKVVNGLQNYLGKQMDKFDDEYTDLMKDTSSLAAGLNRPVEEADIQLIPRPGATMGNMYAPPGWEIRHKYKYKDDRDENRDSSGGQAVAYTYPNGLGPVLMNGCFGTGYVNGDPCFKAKIPRKGCPNMIDGATYLGVGFDGRGVYSAESRKKSVIQRSCENLQTYGTNEVPDSMTPQGIYDTNVKSYTFSSMEGYRQYLAEKSAVTSAKAMFQEEINKASGHGAVGGAFGIGWSAGGGRSSQSGTSSQSSGFSASSSASARLGEKQTRTFMAMLEINIFRYEIFMDDVKPEQLNVGFLRDFVSLPESYFSSGAEITFRT